MDSFHKLLEAAPSIDTSLIPHVLPLRYAEFPQVTADVHSRMLPGLKRESPIRVGEPPLTTHLLLPDACTGIWSEGTFEYDTIKCT